jgi:hypothetical protein
MRVRWRFFPGKCSLNLILMTLLATLPAAAQVKMPPEAERIYQQSDLSDFPLSEMGQRLALSSFGLRYLTDVTLTRAHERLKDCENNTPLQADCRKSNDCCRAEKDIIDRLNREVADYDRIRLAALSAWEEQWFSRMGIATVKDASGNVLVAESGEKEAEKYYDWRSKTRSSDKFYNKPDPYDAMRSKMGIEPHIRDEWLTSQQRAQLAPALLRSFWIQYAREEEFKCRYLIDVQGKDPMDCSAWKKHPAPSASQPPPSQPLPAPPSQARPSTSLPSDRQKLEAIPLGGFGIISLSDAKKTFVNVARVDKGWLFDIPVQKIWKNRDDIVEQLRALGFKPIHSYPQYTPFQNTAPDLDQALLLLSEIKKVLILVD